MGDYGRLFLSIPNTGSRAVVTEMATNDTSTVSAVGTQNNHQGLGQKGAQGTQGTGGSRGEEIATSKCYFKIHGEFNVQQRYFLESVPSPKMVKGWENFRILKGWWQTGNAQAGGGGNGGGVYLA